MQHKSLILPVCLAMTSMASAAIFVDFTSPGAGGGANAGPLVFSTMDPSGTGVSFDVTVSAVIPTGGGANGGNVARNNGGIGSTVENTGGFLNVIGGVSEVLRFTISNVMGLAPGNSLVLTDLLSQNLGSTSANQTGGFGGTFGHNGNDSVTLASDLGSTFVINQSDSGNTGAILLAGDNNTATTGNTFTHSAGDLAFTTFFDLSQTDLSRNDAVVIQGFEFAVVPEPSLAALLSLGGIAILFGRRRRRLE